MLDLLVHGSDPLRILSGEILLNSESSHCADILNGVDSHHSSVLQGLLVACNVATEDTTLDNSTNDDDRYDGDHEECHDPGVDEGNDEREHQSCECL